VIPTLASAPASRNSAPPAGRQVEDRHSSRSEQLLHRHRSLNRIGEVLEHIVEDDDIERSAIREVGGEEPALDAQPGVRAPLRILPLGLDAMRQRSARSCRLQEPSPGRPHLKQARPGQRAQVVKPAQQDLVVRAPQGFQAVDTGAGPGGERGGLEPAIRAPPHPQQSGGHRAPTGRASHVRFHAPHPTSGHRPPRGVPDSPPPRFAQRCARTRIRPVEVLRRAGAGATLG
jgi:hypothetical protein